MIYEVANSNLFLDTETAIKKWELNSIQTLYCTRKGRYCMVTTNRVNEGEVYWLKDEKDVVSAFLRNNIVVPIYFQDTLDELMA